MTDAEEIVSLERRGWDALAEGGAAAPRFYADVLSDNPMFVFPGGFVLDDRDAILDSMSGPGWSNYDLSDLRVLPVGKDAAVVVYRAEADREGQHYTATCSSTYVRRDGTWQLCLHQQSP